MLRWEHLLTPEKVRQIQSEFDGICEQLLAGSPDEDEQAVLEGYAIKGPFSERPNVEADNEGVIDGARKEPTRGAGPREGEPEDYDPTTSTELVAFRWRAYKPSALSSCTANGNSNAASRVFMYSCFDEEGSMEYHLHRLNCKPKRLVQLMQDVRRCSLARNVRHLYFTVTRHASHGGRKKIIGSNRR